MERHWRERLEQALEASHKSKRSVSLAARCGAGYLHDVLSEGKEPTIDRLMRIADVLGVSLSWILYGIELKKPEEELLRAYALLSERQKQAVLELTRSMAEDGG